MKCTIILVAILIFPRIATAQDALSREEAKRQINIAFSAKPDTLPLHLEYKYRTTTITFLREETQEYKNSIIKGLSDGRSSVLGGTDFENLSLAWRAGLIDHFDINISPFDLKNPDSFDGNKPASVVDIDIVALVKDQQKTVCQPVSRPDPSHGGTMLSCNLVLAEKSADQVTGITSVVEQGREIKVVEFEERRELTDVGRIWATTLFGLKSEARPAKAFFLLYDDGWRIVNIFD